MPTMAGLRKFLREAKITAVLNMCDEWPKYTRRSRELCIKEGIIYANLPTYDPVHVDIGDLLRGVTALESAPGAVLVHCKGGRARSASVAMCYFIKVHGLNARKANKFVRQSRPIVKEKLWMRPGIQEFQAHCRGPRKGKHLTLVLPPPQEKPEKKKGKRRVRRKCKCKCKLKSDKEKEKESGKDEDKACRSENDIVEEECEKMRLTDEESKDSDKESGVGLVSLEQLPLEKGERITTRQHKKTESDSSQKQEIQKDSTSGGELLPDLSATDLREAIVGIRAEMARIRMTLDRFDLVLDTLAKGTRAGEGGTDSKG